MHQGPEGAARAAAKRGLAFDLGVLGVDGVLLIAAIAAGFAVVQREFYSPSAFVQRYLDLLARGDAADALTLPGVAVDSIDLEGADLPATAHDALLRRDALGALTDIEVLDEQTDGDITRVTVSYRAGGYPGTTTFDVKRDGQVGIAPTWRFATSPLAVIDLAVAGSMEFDVNGFEIDKRQVSPDGVDADPAAPVSLLAFSPGLYSISVDTAISSTPGVAVLSDSPFTEVPVAIEARATEEFAGVVQQRVEEFLTACATQQVLQPTGCPFGYVVQDRIDSLPAWSIAQQPAVSLVPDGTGWAIPATEAVAHIEVDIRSLFDGEVTHVSEDIPFIVTGKIAVSPDGSATITVSGPDTL